MQGNLAGEITAEVLLTKFSEMLLARRGEGSIFELERAFWRVDTERSGKVIIEEVQGVLSACNHFLPQDEENKVLRHFTSSVGKQAYFDYTNFLETLTVEPDMRRMNLIDKAWTLLSEYSQDSRGHISTASRRKMIDSYNAAKHPKVLSTIATTESISTNWSSMVNDFSADLTQAQFYRFFKQLSAACPYNADYFCVMMENVWGISEMEGKIGKQVELDYLNGLEQMLREKIDQKTRGQENTDKTVKRLFKMFDLSDNGRVNRKQFGRAMENFGMIMPDEQMNAFYLRYKDPEGDFVDYTTLDEQVMRV